MNKLITIGVIGVAAYGIFNLLRMKNVTDEMYVKVVNPRIHKVDWSGLTLKADAQITNPTKDSMSITKPVVSLTSNGSVIAMSKPDNTLIRIQALTESKVSAIELTLPWTTLTPYLAGIIGKIPTIIEAVKKSTASIGKILDIPLEMTISVYADNLFVKSKPIKLN